MKPFAKKYLYSGELVSEDLRVFVEKATRNDASLTRLYASEAVPDPSLYQTGCTAESGGGFDEEKVVQQTFDELVLDPESDVLVLYEKGVGARREGER